mmetsp:Transcript_8287/g.34659  ORF Transcript_8287/g.34659 Transcript_8287/m.34659 type:complete len:306 (+) Transcript_8287:815-1732(+)
MGSMPEGSSESDTESDASSSSSSDPEVASSEGSDGSAFSADSSGSRPAAARASAHAFFSDGSRSERSRRSRTSPRSRFSFFTRSASRRSASSHPPGPTRRPSSVLSDGHIFATVLSYALLSRLNGDPRMLSCCNLGKCLSASTSPKSEKAFPETSRTRKSTQSANAFLGSVFILLCASRNSRSALHLDKASPTVSSALWLNDSLLRLTRSRNSSPSSSISFEEATIVFRLVNTSTCFNVCILFSLAMSAPRLRAAATPETETRPLPDTFSTRMEGKIPPGSPWSTTRVSRSPFLFTECFPRRACN